VDPCIAVRRGRPDYPAWNANARSSLPQARLGPAAACCTVVHKPSELRLGCRRVLIDLFNEAQATERVFSRSFRPSSAPWRRARAQSERRQNLVPGLGCRGAKHHSRWRRDGIKRISSNWWEIAHHPARMMPRRSKLSGALIMGLFEHWPACGPREAPSWCQVCDSRTQVAYRRRHATPSPSTVSIRPIPRCAVVPVSQQQYDRVQPTFQSIERGAAVLVRRSGPPDGQSVLLLQNPTGFVN